MLGDQMCSGTVRSLALNMAAHEGVIVEGMDSALLHLAGVATSSMDFISQPDSYP